MTQLDVTWLRAFKVFWSLCWRLLVYLVAPFSLLSFGALAIPDRQLPSVPPASVVALIVLALFAGVLFGTWLVKLVLSKAYSDFRVILEGPPQRLKIEPRL